MLLYLYDVYLYGCTCMGVPVWVYQCDVYLYGCTCMGVPV